jgi:hypothetical protein
VKTWEEWLRLQAETFSMNRRGDPELLASWVQQFRRPEIGLTPEDLCEATRKLALRVPWPKFRDQMAQGLRQLAQESRIAAKAANKPNRAAACPTCEGRGLLDGLPDPLYAEQPSEVRPGLTVSVYCRCQVGKEANEAQRDGRLATLEDYERTFPNWRAIAWQQAKAALRIVGN